MCSPRVNYQKKAASRSTKRKEEEKKKAEVRGRETVAALWATQTERGGSVAICLFFSSSPTICLCASLIYLIREPRLKATAPNWHQLCVRG